MKLNISELNPAPPRLVPSLVLYKPQATDTPRRIVDLSLRVQSGRVHAWLAKRSELFVGLAAVPGMLGGATLIADFMTNWAAAYMLFVTVPGLAVAVPLMTLGLIGESEEDRQRTEQIWLKNAAKASLADWLTMRCGGRVSTYLMNAVTGDVLSFVNDGAVGRISFELENYMYEVWRNTENGALFTNVPADASTQAVTAPRGTTKKVAAAVDPVELFDVRGRTLLGQAQTLLGMLADVDEVEAAYRVARAGQVVTQTMELAARGQRYGNLQRRRTMQGINRALADAVADLEDVRAGQAAAVEREALVLARYTGQVMAGNSTAANVVDKV